MQDFLARESIWSLLDLVDVASNGWDINAACPGKIWIV